MLIPSVLAFYGRSVKEMVLSTASQFVSVFLFMEWGKIWF